MGIWLLLLAGLVLLAFVMIGLSVAFGGDRRAGFIILGGLAALLGLVSLLVVIYGLASAPMAFGLVALGLVPLAVLVLLLVVVLILTQPRRRRGEGDGRRTDRAIADPGLFAPVFRPARPHQCPDCGADLPAHAPEGLCPRCLLGSGLAGPAPTPPPASPRGTTPHPAPFTAPTPEELAGQFPQLQVLELIGQGGMGAVYKARQTKLDRIVALKLLPPEWGSDPAFAERFTREARTLAKLNHPHVVAVYDFGEAGGLYYLVMEYVDGPNLREVLNAGRLSPEQALAVVPQVCDALQYAHEEGVVHRDIKPENILLDRRGRVKIADFGLAKLLNRPRAEFTLTGSRQVMGTLDYMAPEQRHSPLQIDHRADIYSLGVVFYEMLTGELPLGRFAPPSQKAAVDARLDDVVFRALETEPERRYQSISEVKSEVEAITGSRVPARPAAGLRAGGREVTELEQTLYEVRGPATGLLVAGILTPLAWLLFVLIFLIDPLWSHGRPDDAFVGLLIAFLTSFAPAAILVAGALKMRRCESWEFAFIAALTALTPFTGLTWLLCLPMGVWALLILCKPRVRTGFAHNLKAAPRGTPAGLSRDLVRRLTGPAAGLMVTGILQCVCQVLLAVPVLGGAASASHTLLTGLSFEQAFAQPDSNIVPILLLSSPGIAVALGWLLTGLWIGRAMILAALRMTRLESYRLALKGSILAMVPWTLTSLLTLPVGLWAFIVLRDLDVETAFAPAGVAPLRAVPPPRPTGPVRRRARAFLRSFRAMFFTTQQ
jgi:tRNA A-37 threonylcarbamoyl transferase component Bud32